jgi:hypothetical protein
MKVYKHRACGGEIFGDFDAELFTLDVDGRPDMEELLHEMRYRCSDCGAEWDPTATEIQDIAEYRELTEEDGFLPALAKLKEPPPDVA